MKNWKPKDDDKVWLIFHDGDIMRFTFKIIKYAFVQNRIFRTRALARKAAAKIREVLRKARKA